MSQAKDSIKNLGILGGPRGSDHPWVWGIATLIAVQFAVDLPTERGFIMVVYHQGTVRWPFH